MYFFNQYLIPNLEKDNIGVSKEDNTMYFSGDFCLHL